MQKIMKKFISAALVCMCLLQSCEKSADNVTTNASGSGANGSITRFITYNNYLYIVDFNNLKSFDISSPSSPILRKTTNVGFNIETIFEYKGNLFIGSNNAIFIYGLTNPAEPNLKSQFNYFIPGRDPVVAIDSVAYSTTRNLFGTGGNLNIVNIKNMDAPVGMGFINMPSPYGLAVNQNALYVCNGSDGISVFNRNNAYMPVLERTFNLSNETFYDLIVRGNLMICYVEAGIVLLNVSNPLVPAFISSIKN
jgi:hypothetical protein